MPGKIHRIVIVTGEEGGSGEKACSRDSEEQEEGDKIAALRSTPAETSGLPGSGQSGAAEGRAGRRGSPESAGAVPKGMGPHPVLTPPA